MQPFTCNVGVQIIFLVACLTLFLYQTNNCFLEYLKCPTAKTASYKDMSKTAFPRIELCYGGDFWTQSEIIKAGYKDFKDFVIGRNKFQNGWKAEEDSVRDLFNKVYQKPFLREFLREDSFLKVNGSLRQTLIWEESPMNYQGGLCLKLKLRKTKFSLNSLILKFRDFEHRNESEYLHYIYITITGEMQLKFLDLDILFPQIHIEKLSE